jgi:outer membrane lipoprotein-sorting protein
MYRKFILPLFFIALTMNGLQAQITHTANGNVDANAQNILSKAAKQFNNGTKSFNVSMVSKDANKKQTAKHSAKIVYQGGKYNAVLGNQTVICDGNAVYTLNGDSKEVTINGMSNKEDDLMYPGKLLANWQKNFKAKYIRNEKDGTAVVDMTPKQAKSYYKIRLLISTSGILKRLEMHNYDGSEADFDVSNFKSVKVAADTFTFNTKDHPGMEVIDMR